MRFVVILSAILLTACAHLPALAPVEASQAQAAAERCKQAYPAQPWRATHAIFASLPFGLNGALIGVTAVGAGGLHTVLLSPEGISLFEGVQKSHPVPSLVVQRAVPPFDRPDFAQSLMSDVGHAFLSPAGPPMAIGTYKTGETVCRWSPPDGETTDVELGKGGLDGDGPRTIRTYRVLRLTREILLVGTPAGGFYPLVVLRVRGSGGYELEMRLISRE
jgi:anti-sigma factor RsiW